jgi:hypothetical protein
MKLQMAMNSVVGEAESLRQQEETVRHQCATRAKLWGKIRGDLAAGARKAARGIFWAVVLTLAICYHVEILNFIGPKVSALLAPVKQISDTSSLRQAAVDHENEVADVLQ